MTEGVKKTYDYGMFKTMKGNRDLNKKHIERLIKSMETKYLINPIIVNDNGFVIDGQHRLEAVKQLNLPVYYLNQNTYGLKDTQVLNSTSKSWTTLDYLKSFCEQGIYDYKKYDIFYRRFQFPHQVNLRLLVGDSSKENSVNFKMGSFKIKEWDEANLVAEKIHGLRKYYDGYRRRGFVSAMVFLIEHPKFDFETFSNKLSFQRTKLVDCQTVKEYIAVIEEIYNYKSVNKVSLIYG